MLSNKLLFFIISLCTTMACAQSTAVFYNFETKKYSLEDLKTGKIVSAEYDEMSLMKDGRYQVKQNEKWGFLFQDGKVELPCEYNAVFPSKGYYLFRKRYKTGLFDKNLNVIIPPVYKKISVYKNYIAAVKSDSLGAFDLDGKPLIPFDYEMSRITEPYFFRFNKNKKAGLIDSLNNVIIPFEYTWIFKLSNRTGDFEYMEDNEFHKNDLYGVVNEDGPASVKVGLYNAQGKMLLPVIYEDVRSVYSNNLIGVTLNKKAGFVNLDNKTIIPLVYEEVFPFTDGVSCVRLNRKYGAINDKNEFVIEAKYREPLIFKKGLAKFVESVGVKSKYGFINSKGKIMIAPQYDEAEYLSTGYFRVKKDIGYGIVTLDGKEVIPPIYNGGINVYDKTKFILVKDKKWGVIDDKGKTLIPFEYDYIGNHGTITIVNKNNMYGAYNDKFEPFIPIIYLNIRHYKDSPRITVLDQENKNYNIDFSGKRTTVFE